MALKGLLAGLCATLLLSASASALVMPHPSGVALPGTSIIEIETQDAKDRRLCKGKYKNVGKCKDGVQIEEDQALDADPDELRKTDLDTTESRECQPSDANCPQGQQGSGSQADAGGAPTPATQGEPVLE